MTSPIRKNPYRGSNWFTLNISPDDRHQYYGSEVRHTSFRKYIHTLMLDLPKYKIDYILHFELSTPFGAMTAGYQGPRWHCHGIIRLRNKVSLFNWLNYVLPMLLKENKIEVDSIQDSSIWEAYCKKDSDWSVLEPVTNHHDLWKLCKVSGEAQASDSAQSKS